jgi:hypothetical protein
MRLYLSLTAKDDEGVGCGAQTSLDDPSADDIEMAANQLRLSLTDELMKRGVVPYKCKLCDGPHPLYDCEYW